MRSKEVAKKGKKENKQEKLMDDACLEEDYLQIVILLSDSNAYHYAWLIKFINSSWLYVFLKSLHPHFYRNKYKFSKRLMQNQTSSPEGPEYTTTIQLQQLQESIDERRLSQENFPTKIEEPSSDKNLAEKNDCQEIKSFPQSQPTQSSTKISRLNSTQKEEIKNLGFKGPEKIIKRSKQTEESQQKIQNLQKQIQILEESSQLQVNKLNRQLKYKQEIIKSKQTKISQFEKLISDELKVLKNNRDQLTEKIITDLQVACSAKDKLEIENKEKIERDYASKEEYQRERAQKAALENQLKNVKFELQQIRNYSHQAAQTQQSYSKLEADFVQLRQDSNEQLQLISQLKKKLSQKQMSYVNLKDQLQSLQYTSSSQFLLIQRFEQQVPFLKALNQQLQKKCVGILSQSNDAIFFQFDQEIKTFSQQLNKLNQESTYLKQQIITANLRELEKEKDQMKKEIELSYVNQRIKLLQDGIKNRQASQVETKAEIERIIRLKDQQLQAKQNDVRYLEQIISENTLFYDTLLASKQLERETIGQLHRQQAQNLELIIKIRQQEKKEVINEVKSLKVMHERYIRSMKEAQKQELARAENEAMELTIELQQNKQKFETVCKQRAKLQAEHSSMASLIRLIEKNEDDMQNLLIEIEKINQNHIFDKTAAAFFSLKEKIQNQERKIVSQSQALKRMESSIEDKKAHLQSHQESQQKITQLLQRQAELNSKYESLLKQNSEITSKVKEREDAIQNLKAQLKKTAENEEIFDVSSKNSKFQLQLEQKDIQIERLIAQIFDLKTALEKSSKESIMYKDENNNLSNKVALLSQQIEKGAKNSSPTKSAPDRQLQILKKKYDQLSEELSDANNLNRMMSQMEETYKSTIDELEKDVARLNQRLKRPNKAVQLQQEERPKPSISNTCCFFSLKSMIEGPKGAKQFVVKSVEKYCSREVKGIELVFRKDENNNNSFHASFKPAYLAENICLFLLKKADTIFGIATFPETFKGTPSAFLLSVTNEKCVFKSQEGYDQAFSYEMNAITFGKKEIKIKSGFKNVTISEVVYKGYFESYVKREVFGPEFKEVSEFDNFEIHKIHV